MDEPLAFWKRRCGSVQDRPIRHATRSPAHRTTAARLTYVKAQFAHGTKFAGKSALENTRQLEPGCMACGEARVRSMPERNFWPRKFKAPSRGALGGTGRAGDTIFRFDDRLLLTPGQPRESGRAADPERRFGAMPPSANSALCHRAPNRRYAATQRRAPPLAEGADRPGRRPDLCRTTECVAACASPASRHAVQFGGAACSAKVERAS